MGKMLLKFLGVSLSVTFLRVSLAYHAFLYFERKLLLNKAAIISDLMF